MPSCEKCWRDARGDYSEYLKLLANRDLDGHVCSPREQAGQWWDEKEQRDLRIPIHEGWKMQREGDG